MDAKVGENCLLATKVMIPIDGPIRRDVGLLGSPAFEIPRSVQRDAQFDELKIADEMTRRLPAKNRHNIVSMVLFLAERWFLLFVATLAGAVAVTAHSFSGVLAVAGAMFGLIVLRVLFGSLVERSVMGFRRLKPQYCSIYDTYFWRHERLWKLLAVGAYNGTPFKPIIWRILGVKVGKRLYDAGLNMPEKTLVTIGDDCTINEGTHVQGHSMEDGTFKSDYIVIGNRCSLGVDSWVNYGVNMQDGSSLGPDALLMKGEDVPENATYSGNPAREVMNPAARAILSTPASRGPRHRNVVAVAGGHPKLAQGAQGAPATRAAANAAHGTHRASRDKASRDKAGTPGSGS